MKKSFKLLSAAFVALAGIVSAQATELTVYEGTATNEGAPFYAYQFDNEDYITQTIYPEAALADLQGQSISSIKFYVADEGGVVENNVKLAVSVGMTSEASYSSWSPVAITGLTNVADVTMNAGDTEIVVNFDAPFVYEGGNFVIETKVIEAGTWTNMNFYGVVADVNNVLHQRYSSGVDAFYPKATFTYGGGDTPEPEVLRGDVNGDKNVNIADVTALIDYLLSGNEEGVVLANADCNGDSATNIADVTALIDFLLSGAWSN